MADDWRKIARGLLESSDGQWRISNPWKLRTELRHLWFVAQRRSDGTGWHMHDGHHATLHDARAYIAELNDGISAVSISARSCRALTCFPRSGNPTTAAPGSTTARTPRWRPKP